MTYKTFDLGQVARLPASFTEIDGVTPVDPDTVTFTVELPDGTEYTKAYPSDPAVVHAGLGSFYLDYDTTGGAAGTYFYRTVSTGAGLIGAADSFFVVTAPLVA